MSNIRTSKIRRFAKFARRTLMEQVSNKLDLVLADGKKSGQFCTQSVVEIEELVREHSTSWLVEKVAYIWFNRFCALRYMDVKGYTAFGIVTPERGRFQPELLSNAKEGEFDSTLIPIELQQRIKTVLEKTISVYEVQGGVYRELILAVCNYYQKVMPYLFQTAGDYTELLMPDDLLSQESILAYIRESLTPNACGSEELFSLIYQFYISDKKNDALSVNNDKEIPIDAIPATTQFYTPDYLVRFLVQNSLGKLWMLNNPESKLIEKMDYFIKPECKVSSFLKIQEPEELRICDPACGSGHMLTCAFDLLYSIYEEEGYQPSEIPTIILTNNLYGIEIDERAGQLSALSLTMKARAKDPLFFSKRVLPNICILNKIDLNNVDSNSIYHENLVSEGSLSATDLLANHGINRTNLIHDLTMFANADNFGSLLIPKLTEKDISKAIHFLEQKKSYTKSERSIKALKQASFLSKRYSIVVSNPPHMVTKTMNSKLKKFAEARYSTSNSDLYSMFIERNLELVQKHGFIAMVTLYDWMALSDLSQQIFKKTSLTDIAHMAKNTFNTLAGQKFTPTAFVLEKSGNLNTNEVILDLYNDSSEIDVNKNLLQKIREHNNKY